MRRVSVEYAKLGMILGRAVYDGAGNLVLDTGTVLDAVHMPILSRVASKEIIVQDSRVDDVIIVPMVSEELDALGVRLIHRLIDENRGKLIDHMNLDVVSLDRVAKSMMQGFYSAFMGEFNVEGCLSLANYDYIHPVKVAGLSMLIGKIAGLSKSDIVALGIASLLQDIGYLSIPPHVLVNLDEVDEKTGDEYKMHPEAGYQIILKLTHLDEKVAQAIQQHHERWNGSGFPCKLKGTNITHFARIIAITSTFYCLISRRAGRQPYSPPEAAEYLAAYSGEYFDPELVQIFLRNVALYPKGIMVKLNSGHVGFVTNANIGYIGRPTVRICYRRDNTELAQPYDVDLTQPEQQNTCITEIVDY